MTDEKLKEALIDWYAVHKPKKHKLSTEIVLCEEIERQNWPEIPKPIWERQW